MPTANGSRTATPPLLDLAAIDDSDFVGWLASVTRLNELYMTDVTSMVSAVVKRCSATAGAAVRRLDIIDHGSPEGVEIGSDWITMKTAPMFASQFRLLGTVFAPSGFVHLQHCEAGRNHPLLGYLSRLLGVPVYAGTGAHDPVYRYNRGVYERCVPSGDCESDVGRP